MPTVYGILSRIENTDHALGKSPAALAAGIVFYAMKTTNCQVTQREIALCSFVTETSVRNSFRFVGERLGERP